MCFAKTFDIVYGFPAEYLQNANRLETPTRLTVANSKPGCCHPNVLKYCKTHPEYTPVLCWAIDSNPDEPTQIEAILHSVLSNKEGDLFEITPGLTCIGVVREPRTTTRMVLEAIIRTNTVFANVDTLDNPMPGLDFFKFCEACEL